MKSKTITIRITPALKGKINEWANEHSLKTSDSVREIIEKHLKEWEDVDSNFSFGNGFTD